MGVVMKMNEEVKTLLESSATIINNKYYFLPYWFEKSDDGEYHLHRLGFLPEELRLEIDAMSMRTPYKKSDEKDKT